MNILLGVLDDGRLTDAKGRTVSFANTVIILTSNLGSDLLLEHGNSALAKDLVMGVVKQHFRPEFLNRLDDIVMFDPLGHEQLRKIAAIQVRPKNPPTSITIQLSLPLTIPALNLRVEDCSSEAVFQHTLKLKLLEIAPSGCKINCPGIE
jgi:ATP-dependent Clp protease ATP-binding subunit ClpA